MTAKRRPGHKAPKGYDRSEYPQFAVTVDVVILTIVGDELQVLLVRRRDDPCCRSSAPTAIPAGTPAGTS